jgi:hypothetical protein
VDIALNIKDLAVHTFFACPHQKRKNRQKKSFFLPVFCYWRFCLDVYFSAHAFVLYFFEHAAHMQLSATRPSSSCLPPDALLLGCNLTARIPMQVEPQVGNSPSDVRLLSICCLAFPVSL